MKIKTTKASAAEIMNTYGLPAINSVRWHVWKYLTTHSELLIPPILEIGSLAPEHAWWRQLRQQLGFAKEDWLGVDLQEGFNVDVVFDMTKPLRSAPTLLAPGFFETCVCAEVLEHVYFPLGMLDNIWRLLVPGGWAIFTIPFCFPIHGYPDDYHRYTPHCLRRMLQDSGFQDVMVDEINPLPITLTDHTGQQIQKSAPMHIGAIAKKPGG